jgi:hypothetical protein
MDRKVLLRAKDDWADDEGDSTTAAVAVEVDDIGLDAGSMSGDDDDDGRGAVGGRDDGASREPEEIADADSTEDAGSDGDAPAAGTNGGAHAREEAITVTTGSHFWSGILDDDDLSGGGGSKVLHRRGADGALTAAHHDIVKETPPLVSSFWHGILDEDDSFGAAPLRPPQQARGAAAKQSDLEVQFPRDSASEESPKNNFPAERKFSSIDGGDRQPRNNKVVREETGNRALPTKDILSAAETSAACYTAASRLRESSDADDWDSGTDADSVVEVDEDERRLGGAASLQGREATPLAAANISRDGGGNGRRGDGGYGNYDDDDVAGNTTNREGSATARSLSIGWQSSPWRWVALLLLAWSSAFGFQHHALC